MRKPLWLLAALFLLPAQAHATVVFNGQNFGVAGQECKASCSYNGWNPNASIFPWAFVQFDRPTNTGNYYKVVSTPIRKPGRETAELHLVPQPAGTAERIQFRTSQTAYPATGKDLWFAASYQFRPGVGYPRWISLLDVGTQYNTHCTNPVANVGASVPELYFHNDQAAAIPPAGIPATSTRWQLYAKVAGGHGSGNFPCSVRFYNPLRMGAIPTGVPFDVLEHFHYSAIDGQGLTELWFRFGPTTWTFAFSTTQANLVRPDSSDSGIDIHYGDYAEDESAVRFETGLDLEGLVVATSRAEAESLAF